MIMCTNLSRYSAPRARYPDRARFEVKEEGKKIDLKIVDVAHPNYLGGKRFEQHLKHHPEDLENYRLLKESLAGSTVKEYYRQKIEFINEILRRTEESSRLIPS